MKNYKPEVSTCLVSSWKEQEAWNKNYCLSKLPLKGLFSCSGKYRVARGTIKDKFKLSNI
jgi:hypothetical protein